MSNLTVNVYAEKMWQWRITDFESGHSLREALALRIPAAPRAFLHQLIRKGRIRRNGFIPAPGDICTAADCLAITPSARLEELAADCGLLPQHVLYEDAHVLVVFKPAGLATHQAAAHNDNLTDRVTRYITLRHAHYRIAPVHRLDIGTSGPVMFGKGRQATGRLGQLLMAGQLRKHYLALVRGEVPAGGELATPVPDAGRLKPALTRYRRLQAAASFCLLELDLITGRPHQLRRQLADAGWPIIGDRRYGGPAWPELAYPFLHCHRLEFPALDTGKACQVNCPLPAPLTAILVGCGFPTPPAALIEPENSATSARTGYNIPGT